jgi:signal transduction histidine kinase
MGKQVPVRLNVGEQLIYEWTEREVLTEKNSLFSDRLTTIRYSVLIYKIENGKVLFTIQTLQNRTETQGNGASFSEDRGFPQLINNFWVIPNTDLANETLHQKKFQYELDLNTRTILLTNGPELLGQCEFTLAAKGYSAEIRLKIIDEIKTGLQKQPLLEPFLFVNSNIDQATIHQQDLGLNFITTKRNEEQVELSSAPDSLNQSYKCILNLQFGLVTSFSKNSIEKTKRNHRFFPDSRFQISQQLKLLQKSFPKQPKVIISGHIENPVSDQVVVYTLNKFIGTDLDSKMVYLDKAGNFRIEAKLENRGLVLVTNPNKNQNIAGPVILLYAEPGDSLHMNTRLALKEFRERILIPRDSKSMVKEDYIIPEAISFSGDRKMEAELLNKFQGQLGFPSFRIKNNNLSVDRDIFDAKIRIINNNLYFDRGMFDAKIYLNQLNLLEKQMISARKNSMSQSMVYLEHELQAFFYSRLFEARPELGKGQWISNLTVIKNDIKDQVQAQLDTFNINRIYNDYGLFSRGLTSPYARYKYNQLVPMSKMIISNIQLSLIYDVELNLQFYKLVLSGSPLYHEMANRLFDHSFSSLLSYDKLKAWQRTIDETVELMILRCNDVVFINALRELQNSQSNWNDLRFIPEPGFLNLQKQPAALRSFITEKPSIVYSSDNWSVGRYEMDELAPKYAEISFILINDGSNYEIWKSWNDRAEPKAHQLFFINGSLRLKDIFQDKFKRYIIYNRLGKRIGVESDLKDAIEIAKKSLEPKEKEISKSTLTGIVQLLSLLLVLSIVVFLIYKYRMRLQLKKQGQEKRLQELQMAAIRSQMNPHFLFNSLNSVQNLIQQNRTQEANLYLSDFAGLIRKVLRNSNKEEVSLAEELEMLEQYLKLEKLRFDFEYTIYVDDQIDQNLFMLPSMILQPIAENALTHGLQHKTGDKKITIRILNIENSIQIIIEDNGIGIQASQKLKTNSNGFGLRMNEERIQMMKAKNGGNYSFKLTDLSEQDKEGTRVEIIIPEEQ